MSMYYVFLYSAGLGVSLGLRSELYITRLFIRHGRVCKPARLRNCIFRNNILAVWVEACTRTPRTANRLVLTMPSVISDDPLHEIIIYRVLYLARSSLANRQHS